jgi:hypothetical protein
MDASMDLPLLSNLPRGEYYRQVSRFASLTPGSIASLDETSLALLLQWMFEVKGLATRRIQRQDDHLDLDLANPDQMGDEIARVYTGGAASFDLLRDLLSILENWPARKIHLYTLGRFTPEQRQMEVEFPLVLELVDGEELVRRLLETQRVYRQPRRAGRKQV